MKRVACALLLLPLLLLGTACRGGAAPTQPGSDQQVNDIESTLDAIEAELGED